MQTLEQLDPKEIQKKLQLANDLFMFAYLQKRFQIKQNNPHLTDVQLNHRAYALIEKGCK